MINFNIFSILFSRPVSHDAVHERFHVQVDVNSLDQFQVLSISLKLNANKVCKMFSTLLRTPISSSNDGQKASRMYMNCAHRSQVTVAGMVRKLYKNKQNLSMVVD